MPFCCFLAKLIKKKGGAYPSASVLFAHSKAYHCCVDMGASKYHIISRGSSVINSHPAENRKGRFDNIQNKSPFGSDSKKHFYPKKCFFF